MRRVAGVVCALLGMALAAWAVDFTALQPEGYISDFARVIDLVGKGVLHPAQVVTHAFPFERVGQALELAGTGTAGKIHIKMA